MLKPPTFSLILLSAVYLQVISGVFQERRFNKRSVNAEL
jgi:hypothetical protein